MLEIFSSHELTPVSLEISPKSDLSTKQIQNLPKLLVFELVNLVAVLSKMNCKNP